MILPKDVEGEHLTVVVEERLKSLVGAATLEADLNVLLDLSLIRGSLLIVDHGTGVSEVVLGKGLSGVEGAALVGIEASGEVIAVDNSEDTLVHVQVLSNVEVPPGIVLGLVLRERKLVSLEEDALRNTSVLNAGLNDVKSVIIKIVVDDAFADTEVFVGVLDDGLLEVSVELEHLQFQKQIVSACFQ